MTRSIIAAGLVALIASGPTTAMEHNHGDMHHAAGSQPAPAATRSFAATGVVKQVDAAAGKVTIDHEPIKELYWPSMTMDFAVKDKALLGKLAAGSKVNFEIAKVGRDYVITSVK